MDSQIDKIVELHNQFKKVEAAFLTALDEAGYSTILTSDYRCWRIHPDHAKEADEEYTCGTFGQKYLNSLPAGAAFEVHPKD